ncbi:MAG: bifunctional diguanylate cyclase/phosphodiesterase [Gammaproteobacteria bacterium]|nr:bifunctional diguanylate cyclase/phosphodiesterase [Gammaproteobacteria bacterium]
MVERSFLPVLVISQSQNNAEKLNGILRAAGHAVRSSWASNLDDAENTIKEQEPDIILCFLKVAEAPINDVIAMQKRLCPNASLLAVTAKADDTAAAAVLERGGRDLVSMENERRLIAVIKREAEYVEQLRALETAQTLVNEYQSRFQEFLAESGDAIAYVQEGILTQANPAFAEMFGFDDVDDVDGNTVMDLFHPEDKDKLKKSLVAATKGMVVDELKVRGMKNGEPFETKLEFAQTELDGEPCLELAIRGEGDTAELQAKMQSEIEEMGKRDPLTGLFTRHHFVEISAAELQSKKSKDSRALVLFKPDHFSDIEEKVGPLASDTVLKSLGEFLGENLDDDKDDVARFGGNLFAAIVRRKSIDEIEKTMGKLNKAIASKIFEAGGRSTNMTVSIGIADFENEAENVGSLIYLAQQATKQARDKGGNTAVVYKPAEVDEEGKLLDTGWVKKITSALKENRFQLVYQPIASLEGDVSEKFDILVRMKDEDGNEVMPGEFIPAAQRNNLMTGIDRWIVSHALTKLKKSLDEGKKAQFFIRLSDQTVSDAKFSQWLDGQLKNVGLPAKALIIQVAESIAEQNLKETKDIGDTCRKYKQGIALEHFGVGRSPMQMFDHIKMSFVKIDGSFMDVIGKDEAKRNHVQEIIEKAKELDIETVAERVENANTMAVLWQLGINYIQGNYVQEPEVVMAEDARLPM